jgi:cobalt transporter subunit CbtA
MFYRVFMSALVAGVLGGLVISVVQAVTTTPLIIKAETYESAPAPAKPAASAALSQAAGDGHSHAHAAGGHEHDHGEGWAPADGPERLAFTLMTNIVAGFGFALLIVGCFALGRRNPNAGEGLLWGLAGFTVFTLAPALGLAPELPATAAADLAARQAWWLGTAAASALGLWLLVFRPGAIAKAVGVAALILPHAIGAPHPHNLTNAVPPELAAQFAAAAIGTQAVFWVLLGCLAGAAYLRLGSTADAGRAGQPAAA